MGEPARSGGMGLNLAVLQAALDGARKACSSAQLQRRAGLRQPKVWREGLVKTDLVNIDADVRDGARVRLQVLPMRHLLERMSSPSSSAARNTTWPCARRCSSPSTRDEAVMIFAGLAEAWASTVHRSCSPAWTGGALTSQGEGIVELSDPGFEYKTPAFKVPD